MILKPLKEVHPGDGWNDPQLKSSMLGHCAAEYFSITQHIQASFRQFPYTYTLIANMHLSLELVVKAIAIKLIPSFNAKRFRHKTSDILNEYSDQIDEFRKIFEDLNRMNLIKELEEGFVEMRYGELYSSFDRNDLEIYNKLFDELIDFLNSITQVKFIQRHFLKQN